MNEIFNAITTVINAESDLSALNGVWYGLAPIGTAFPYGEVHVVANNVRSAYQPATFRLETSRVQVSLFDADADTLSDLQDSIEGLLHGTALSGNLSCLLVESRQMGTGEKTSAGAEVFQSVSVFELISQR